MDKIKVMINNEEIREFDKGISVLDFVDEYKDQYDSKIILVKVNDELRELKTKLYTNSKIEFLDMTNSDSIRVYERSLSFILNMSVKELYSKYKLMVHHSINKGLYCEINDGKKIIDVSNEILHNITQKMNEIIEKDLIFEKIVLKRRKAIEIFKQNNMDTKVDLFKYRNSSYASLYKLDWLYDYFYGYMVPSTKYLDIFELNKKGNGFVINHPTIYSPNKIPEISDQVKLYNIFQETDKEAKSMDVTTIANLNNIIANNKIKDLMLITEALQEKKIGLIADKIKNSQKDIKVILIAGPSSSGKTTFAKRLSIQLKANGYKPHAISLDDYFVDREKTPLDEDGNYNFESIEALDVKLFNDTMNKLILGEEVDMPTFNFKKGKREYLGNKMKLDNEDILVIEGIHGLNPILSQSISEDKKFKIYISALTQLNLDEHNRIPTTDNRLLRRIVRDNNYRGHSAAKTIAMWPSVRKGEEENIFPYQEEADIMFNSALVYEIALLKQYAEPLLYNIDPSMPEYSEAKRLLKFLRYILGISSELVPRNSLVREFIGGGYFY